ncbi:hypothetical protein D910_04561 [Dendroctonus ponderosae]|uniref:Uncharacterized protein n=1 Tax=Dendroctonus ponderosae TaxID=77166 RepID=U4U963_DENPD|nr:hypothetical protein D910_04561 [Dendroctonus ponderosae]
MFLAILSALSNQSFNASVELPAVVEDLRRWTSDEALGDVTVGTNCNSHITATFSDGDQTDGGIASDEEPLDHKLPSPEEQLQIVALRFPAQLVAVDISGRSFDRMSMQRRSLMSGEVVNQTVDGDTVRRRGRTRRPRNRRRNTLAGTDQKEIQSAITAGHATGEALMMESRDQEKPQWSFCILNASRFETAKSLFDS